VVTLLTPTPATVSSIRAATTVDDLRVVAASVKSGYSGPTTPQGVALAAPGLFEIGVRLLEIVSTTSRLHNAITTALLTALDKDVQSAGLAAVKAAGGETRRIRYGAEGHSWREISDQQLGSAFLVIRTEIDRLLTSASGQTAIRATAIGKALREELFSLWAVDTRLSLGDDFGDDDEFDAD